MGSSPTAHLRARGKASGQRGRLALLWGRSQPASLCPLCSWSLDGGLPPAPQAVLRSVIIWGHPPSESLSDSPKVMRSPQQPGQGSRCLDFQPIACVCGTPEPQLSGLFWAPSHASCLLASLLGAGKTVWLKVTLVVLLAPSGCHALASPVPDKLGLVHLVLCGEERGAPHHTCHPSPSYPV